jgi:hypothetical protein
MNKEMTKSLKSIKLECWSKDNLHISYNDIFYLVHGSHTKLKLINNKFQKLKNDFIEKISSIENTNLLINQLIVDDIKTTENEIISIVNEYIEDIGNLIENDIEEELK